MKSQVEGKHAQAQGVQSQKKDIFIKEKEKILERWEEYVKELYVDNERNKHFRIRLTQKGHRYSKVKQNVH